MATQKNTEIIKNKKDVLFFHQKIEKAIYDDLRAFRNMNVSQQVERIANIVMNVIATMDGNDIAAMVFEHKESLKPENKYKKEEKKTSKVGSGETGG